jgi:hypothetical protein
MPTRTNWDNYSQRKYQLSSIENGEYVVRLIEIFQIILVQIDVKNF